MCSAYFAISFYKPLGLLEYHVVVIKQYVVTFSYGLNMICFNQNSHLIANVKVLGGGNL
jgi:hypothetical protein